MKKLLFLTAAIGFAFSVNAQQIDYRKQNVPASNENLSAKKMDMQLVAKPATFLKADVQIQKSAKSTNATYTFFKSVWSADFISQENNGLPPAGYSVTLFPDSLASPYTYRTDDDSIFNNGSFMSTGYAFDPYSSSFDGSGKGNGLFSTQDTLYGYKIDTITILADYQIANYDEDSPDTLRFYAFTLDVYYRGDGYREVYNLGYVGFDKEGTIQRNVVFPNVTYTDPIPQKGSAVTPKAPYITWDYILSLNDTIILDPGYTLGKYMSSGIPDGGMEVPPGSLFVVLMKFIPGYDYNVNDTISKRIYHQASQTSLSEEIRLNRFRSRYWDLPQERNAQYAFWDNNGYNSHLVESKSIRYAKDTTDFGNGTFYDPGYPAKAILWLDVYVSDEFVAKTPPAVIEPNQLVSAIYPNPATSTLTIDLKAEGLTDITVYNILGQAVLQDQVSDLSNTINVSGLSQGIYTVKIRQNGKTSSVKFSKQ